MAARSQRENSSTATSADARPAVAWVSLTASVSSTWALVLRAGFQSLLLPRCLCHMSAVKHPKLDADASASVPC